jgi:hypothetical protein
MTILRVRHRPLTKPHRFGNHRLELTPDCVQLGQRASQLARPQPFQVGKLRHLDRTHV